MDHWTLILSILAGLLVVYYYAWRLYKGSNPFSQHGIPYENINPVRRLLQLFLFPRSYASYVLQLYNLHRDAKYVAVNHLLRWIVVIREPEMIKWIGIKNFESFEDHVFFGAGQHDPLLSKNLLALRGNTWRKARALLSPAFTSSKLKLMYRLMSECAVNFTEYLRTDAPPEGRATEMRDALTRYANDVIATCAFGISVDSMRQPNNDFYVHGRKVTNFNTLMIIKILVSQHLPTLSRLLNLKMMDDRSCEFLVKAVTDTVRSREQSGIARPDILQLMMDDRENERSGERLTMVDITSHAFIFFLAGFDSSSTAMSFAAYELVANPRVQDELRREIDHVLDETDGQPSYDRINRMAYMSAVISETLRMYPPQPLTDRVCTKDLELPATLPGAKPYLVRKGDVIWIPFYGLHYDPEYFAEPNEFKPERFLDENQQRINVDAYYPFGLGPRMCIGNRFALMEMKVVLFHLLARCELQPCERTPSPMQLKRSGFSMRIKGGCWMNVVPRRNQHPTIAKAE